MAYQYTGNPAGIHAPDTGPAAGHFPTILIPNSGDAPEGGLFEQPLMTLADAAAFLMTQIGPATPPWFGDGSDGPVVIAGTTNLSGVVKNYTNLTINNAAILNLSRCIIRVNGTLTITGTGVIRDNGAAASGPTKGTGTDGIGGSISTPCPISGGTSGATGVISGAGAAGADFAIDARVLGLVQNSELAYVGYSAKGGAGGAGSGGVGGAAGCASAASDDLVAADLLFGSIFTPGFVHRTRFSNHGAGDKGTYAELVPLRGGSGGGAGAGDGGGAPGGGSGAGGGVVIVFAKTVVSAAANCIQALGGNGANGGSTNVGGGGGGGGGRVFLIHGGLTGTALTTACVAGGSGGSSGGGTGVAGSAGATGTLTAKQIA